MLLEADRRFLYKVSIMEVLELRARASGHPAGTPARSRGAGAYFAPP